MLTPGSRVGGYEIVGVLGHGGMGTVYEATQVLLSRTVALKLMEPRFTTDLAFRERFRREGMHQAAIEHPHIVTVYEAGESEHGLFIAMRFVKGLTLKEIITNGGLEPERTLSLLTQVADALDAAHEAEIVHRDVKPQNILVAPRDHAFLADFGLTKVASATSITDTGQFVGTIDYVAPEQVTGDPTTSRSDVYSLGAVLYECLTGQVPYSRDSRIAVLYAHLSAEPPRVSDQRPDLPTDLDDVIQRGLAKDPLDRFACASELITAARTALSPSSRPVPASARPVRPVEVPADVKRRVETRPRGAATEQLERGPAGSRTRWERILTVVAAAIATVLFVLGIAGGHEKNVHALTAGTLELSYGDSWSQAARARVAGLPLQAPLTLRHRSSPDALFVAGSLSSEGAPRDPAPATFTRTFKRGRSSRRSVRIGGYDGVLYEALRGAPGDKVHLFIFGTTRGYVAAGCRMPAAAPRSVVRSCDDEIAGLRLRGAAPEPAFPSRRYATRLNEVIARLGRTRASAGGLRSKKRATRARAAQQLGEAHNRAAAAVRRLPAQPQDAAANKRLAAVLQGFSSSFSHLASAARHNQRHKYDGARAQLSKEEAALTAALDQLKVNGYPLAGIQRRGS